MPAGPVRAPNAPKRSGAPRTGAGAPVGAPAPAVRAQGAAFWDKRGRRYVDFGSGAGALLFGYADPDVDRAAYAQLSGQGPTPEALEAELGERVGALVPCAERIRFARAASEAWDGAILAARAATDRDRVVVCHPRGGRLPVQVRGLLSTCPYDDMGLLEELCRAHAGEIAAVVLSPIGPGGPSFGYLQAVRRLADRFGALLVFDETVSGFRCDPGGAQALFGVIPDLAVFGPGLANGLPIASVAGPAELIDPALAERALSPDPVSLAAAIAVLDKLDREPVATQLRVRGAEVQAEVEALLTQTCADGLVTLSGDPTWSFLEFASAPGLSAHELKALFLQACMARGVYLEGAHVITLSHGDEEITQLLDAYAEVFPMLVEAAARGGTPAT